jgi:DNA-3-methyladenine glycosylase II
MRTARNQLPSAQQWLAQADPVLAQVMASLPEPLVTSSGNVFHDLMSCVLEQQVHYRSTKKTFQKMLAAAGLVTLTPENFPQFEALAFAQIKLATDKYETALRVLEFWQANPIAWEQLNDQEVIAKLSAIKGIGQWTIDMILLYTLQRPNVFPADDFHLKEIMVSAYSLDAKAKLKAQMLEVASTWGEHKSLAVKYLLAWKAQAKKPQNAQK